jgi:hypothetical protein
MMERSWPVLGSDAWQTTLDVLLKYGADPAASTDDGITPLYISITQNKGSSAPCSLFRSAKPEDWSVKLGPRNQSYLKYAIEQQDLDVITYLVRVHYSQFAKDEVEMGISLTQGHKPGWWVQTFCKT